ncbi:MAG: DUF5320 domain-containing protein [Nitrospirae bacterium]|nr:DUF5320 domain-containing protein [Nitrospirota bacterium]
MCQGNISVDLKKSCGCEPESDKGIPNKEELLTQLKEYKRNLESELALVKNKLKAVR